MALNQKVLHITSKVQNFPCLRMQCAQMAKVTVAIIMETPTVATGHRLPETMETGHKLMVTMEAGHELNVCVIVRWEQLVLI